MSYELIEQTSFSSGIGRLVVVGFGVAGAGFVGRVGFPEKKLIRKIRKIVSYVVVNRFVS